MQEYAPFAPMSQLLGVWIAAFLTVALYSFLFKDNPLYKLAEHVFVGTSAGYFFARSVNDIILKKCIYQLFASEIPPGESRDLWLVVPLFLGILMIAKVIPRQEWIARWPLAFVVGTGVGIQIISYFQSNCITQVRSTLAPFASTESLLNYKGNEIFASLGWFVFYMFWFVVLGAAVYLLLRQFRMARNFEVAISVLVALFALAVFSSHSKSVAGVLSTFATHWGALVNGLLLATGVVCGLIYFFFSIEHKGVVFGGLSRVGIWFLMISFGASFGYTVMGRVSLLIGRIEFLLRLPEMTSILSGMM